MEITQRFDGKPPKIIKRFGTPKHKWKKDNKN
jgi:hypothetical protein